MVVSESTRGSYQQERSLGLEPNWSLHELANLTRRKRTTKERGGWEMKKSELLSSRIQKRVRKNHSFEMNEGAESISFSSFKSCH